MSMMRDITLSSEELSHVIAKSLRQLTEMDQNELPPLVYQLLLLSAKVCMTVAHGSKLCYDELVMDCTFFTDLHGLLCSDQASVITK